MQVSANLLLHISRPDLWLYPFKFRFFSQRRGKEQYNYSFYNRNIKKKFKKKKDPPLCGRKNSRKKIILRLWRLDVKPQKKKTNTEMSHKNVGSLCFRPSPCTKSQQTRPNWNGATDPERHTIKLDPKTGALLVLPNKPHCSDCPLEGLTNHFVCLKPKPIRALRLLLPCLLKGLRCTKWSLCNVPIPTKQQNKNRTPEVTTFTSVLLQRPMHLQTCGFLYKQEPCISLLPGSRILQGWGLELPSEMCLISINCFKGKNKLAFIFHVNLTQTRDIWEKELAIEELLLDDGGGLSPLWAVPSLEQVDLGYIKNQAEKPWEASQ